MHILKIASVFFKQCIYVSNSDVWTCSFYEVVDEVISSESLQFDFATIRVATNNFSDANKLGQGGFGAVYKVIWKHHITYHSLS
jgi:hypothetical protein